MCFLMNLLYLTIVIFARSSYQVSKTKSAFSYLPDAKFSYTEYNEYPDTDETLKGPQAPLAPQYAQLPSRRISQDQTTNASPSGNAQGLDPSIKWDEKWPSAEVKFGQLSAVSIDPDGNIAAFSRGSRIWGSQTFDDDNKFDRDEGPIRENTVTLLNAVTGKTISEWGRSTFYLPHGLTIDLLGNYWITDVAMHQVFKFAAEDIPKDLNREKKEIKPVLVLGVAFEPGNDNNRFCKPTAVAVQKNGDFFISDGYCNSRIIKFNHKGERILTWGRNWGGGENLLYFARPPPPNFFFVPHALALAEELGYIFVADRENGRISSFHAINGTFHKEYRQLLIGSRIFSIAYAAGKIYAVNGPEIGRTVGTRIRGFVLDINTGEILSQFAPGKDLQNPHDVVVTPDGKAIYVVELNPYKIHKFLKDSNNGTISISNTQVDQKPKKISDSLLPPTGIQSSLTPQVFPHEIPVFSKEGGSRLISSDDSSTSKRVGVTASTIILSLVTAAVILVALCVGIAAVIARCRKRGCLLTVRRRWEMSERRENFKLSNLLESRKSKGLGSGPGSRKFFDKRPNTRDFRKLNTEPETSDDENNLTKII